MRHLTAVPAVGLLAVGLSGCSFSIGGAEVPGDELAEQVSTVLTETVGEAPDLVECPDPLDAEVGAEVRCTLTHAGQSYGVSVTATEVEDEQVFLDVQVDEEPLDEGLS
ncbi:DUF4333 domain-containing protein [Actinotalea sp. C106]|uniref:DUF4333 domain-containing protein n=1 Tax=Actinotalea sp. C106 TaxID=2908644 RepID=UPI00202840FF|nr:DUF4333 domain-containing protein [Actinotalea sp. C106]